VDGVIDDEDKALILLSSLPDEGYETFVPTLINGRTSLSYSEVTTAHITPSVMDECNDMKYL